MVMLLMFTKVFFGLELGYMQDAKGPMKTRKGNLAYCQITLFPCVMLPTRPYLYTVTEGDVATFPAASQAFAEMVWAPDATRFAFQV
jgi:hypothetical protein